MARGISIHVGVNQVDPSVYGSPLTLRGCENDARSMQLIAQAAGFDMAASELILSRDATAQVVSDAIRAAAAAIDPGDILFLTYSGHGGQVPDPTGEEIDAKDETWVLYDRQLIDDELYALWAEFPAGARIFVLSDSCHSGTVVKRVTGELYDSTREATLNSMPILVRDLVGLGDAQPVTKDLPFLVQSTVYFENQKLYDGLPRARDLATEVTASVILISGCQDNQVSLDGTVNGLFTEKLLTVWQNGNFTGDYESFRVAIANLLPPTQSPNFVMAGMPSLPFKGQRPLTILSPVGTVSPTQIARTWMDHLPLGLENIWKEKGMAASTATVEPMQAQEKWAALIPGIISLGMEVFDVLSKEGFQLQDSAGQKVASTKDFTGGEQKFWGLIPELIGFGTQVYDALSKQGALPADKQVTLPKDFSPEATKSWLADLIPVVVNLGTEIYNAVTKEGSEVRLDAPEAQGPLDLIPVCLTIGQKCFDCFPFSPGLGGFGAQTWSPVMTHPTPVAPKEVVGGFSKEVALAANKAAGKKY